MIPLVKPFLPPKEKLLPALEQTLYSGYIAEGAVVKNFEDAIGEFIGNKLVLSLNSGTAALHLALILAGVKAGDEVISTVLTAEPTNVAIKQTGARIVWADIDYQTGTISAKSVREKITPLTKAIMLVHYAGVVGDLAELSIIAAEYKIPIIEDAAHALGAKFDYRYIGSISDYTIFSFQAIKHMTTIDGGLLAVKNVDDYDSAKRRRWFGLDKSQPRLDNDITEVGYKYHMNNVNATVGLVQMEYLKMNIEKHISNGQYFDDNLANVPGIEVLQYYSKTYPSYWLYTMKVEKRSDFIYALECAGIVASELHLRNDRHSIFRESKTTLPVFDAFYSKMVHIPCGWWVTAEDRTRIVEVIKKGW
ncbi:MAG: aminotransferase class V-fold PLP-dependent enzyme [Sphingobacteriales bacterium]|nr:MAG: aminotransferase class V-fold PLP-dependent enzyme [Sphingobacteriales bacterium]